MNLIKLVVRGVNAAEAVVNAEDIIRIGRGGNADYSLRLIRGKINCSYIMCVTQESGDLQSISVCTY